MSKTHGIQWWRWLAAVALGMAMAGPAAAQSSDRNVLRVVPYTGLRSIDPILTASYITRNFGYMVFDTLFAIDDKFEAKPQMVKEWSVTPDKLTYTFTLRGGLKFHDGTPVTSADCIASLQRWGKRDTQGIALMGFTQELTAVDDKTFKLVLREPYGQVLEALARPPSYVPFIMPKRLAETPPDKAMTEAIGSGPFKFVASEFQPGVKAAFEKNRDYVPRSEPANWLSGGKVVKIDRVEWITMSDPQTATNALINNEVDFIESPPFTLLPTLKKAAHVKVEDLRKVGYQGNMQINWLQPPFNNLKARQALLAAVYQGDFMQAQIGDPAYYNLCGSMYSCMSPFASDVGATQIKPADLAHAKKLLQESGYKGETVGILQSTDVEVYAPGPLVTAQALRAIGMKVEVISTDQQTSFARRANRNPVNQGGWSISQGAWMQSDILSPAVNGSINASGTKGAYFGWPEDAEIERMRAAFSRETDPAKQKELATEIQKRAYEVVAYIPTGEWRVPYAFRDSLTGLVGGPAPVFWGVSKN
jgi:peptide/nickel transport system substrate-binding protein